MSGWSDACGTYAWAVYVAEVSVDMSTFEISVDDFVAVQEVGKVINQCSPPDRLKAVSRRIGWALYEHVAWREGRMVNAQMTSYIMPTSMDVPPIRVFFEEQPYAHGPAGARDRRASDGRAGACDRQRRRARDRRSASHPDHSRVAHAIAGDGAPDEIGDYDSCHVNGAEVTFEVTPGAAPGRVASAAATDRHERGCGGECGACSVLVNGDLVTVASFR
jgi:hypothetical protein